MKYLTAISVSAALALVACETMNAPLTTSGNFDPLSAAGGGGRPANSVRSSSFKPGQFVRAAMDNTAFFAKRPKGDGDANKLLPRDTQMKVISSDSSYVKVELDSGEIGFVPSVMVNDPSAAIAGLPGDPSSGMYPPISPAEVGAEPLPVFDTSGLPPPGSVPPVITTPPGGVPPIVDPAAPTPTPAGNAVTTAPELPPGIDDVTPSKPAEKKPLEVKPIEEKPADEKPTAQ